MNATNKCSGKIAILQVMLEDMIIFESNHPYHTVLVSVT